MRVSKVGRLSAGLAMTLLSFTRASADDVRPAVQLDWRAPEACPDARSGQRMVAEYLGARAANKSHSVTYAVEITRVDAARFRARIRSEQAQPAGERILEGADCAGVAEAAALIVSMTFDPIAAAASIHEASEIGRARAAPPVRWSLGASLGADLGSLPEPSLGAGLVLGAQADRVHLSANATAWAAQSVARGPVPGGGHIDLFSGALRGCWTVLRSVPSELELAPCLVLELGASTGRGVGVFEPVTSAGFWGTPLLGLSLRQLSTRGLQASFAIEAGVPIFRPTFAIYQGGDLFHASLVVFRVSIGAAWVFFE